MPQGDWGDPAIEDAFADSVMYDFWAWTDDKGSGGGSSKKSGGGRSGKSGPKVVSINGRLDSQALEDKQ